MNRHHSSRILAAPLVAALLAPAVLAQSSSVATRPPVARKAPHLTTIHGDTLKDDYFWLREKSNPEVISYLKAENAYTDETMKPTEGLQKTLYTEMLGRIKQTDLSVPSRIGDYYYYSRTEEGKQYPYRCRRKGSMTGAEEILLDLNTVADGAHGPSCRNTRPWGLTPVRRGRGQTPRGGSGCSFRDEARTFRRSSMQSDGLGV